MWSPRFDNRRPQRRPQRLLEDLRTLPARCAVWIAARTQGATTEKLSDFRHCWSRSCRQRRSAQDGSATSRSGFWTETSARRAPERRPACRHRRLPAVPPIPSPAAPSHPQGRRRQPVPEAVTRGELRPLSPQAAREERISPYKSHSRNLCAGWQPEGSRFQLR